MDESDTSSSTDISVTDFFIGEPEKRSGALP
jgi:hypothetical protein